MSRFHKAQKRQKEMNRAAKKARKAQRRADKKNLLGSGETEESEREPADASDPVATADDIPEIESKILDS